MTITAPSTASVQILLTQSVGNPADAVAQAFIDDAMALAAQCPCIESQLPTGTATIIVKYLAAHLYVVSANVGAGSKIMETLGDAQSRWNPASVGEGLKQTTYGQQAIALDTTGCLLTLGQKSAQMEVLTDTDTCSSDVSLC